VAITPVGFVGFIATPVWTLAASIALYLRWNAPPTGPATTPTAPATSPESPA
jgi:hypothetical protein